MRNVLITGATGLIGRHLVAKLKGNCNVTVISRDPNRAERLFGNSIEAAICLHDLQQVDEFDVIINLAGESISKSRWTVNQKHIICESRWYITRRLVDLINKSANKPSVMISGSAIGYYGRQGDTPINEDFTDFHDEFSREVCEKWENIALQAKTRVCILRTGVVLDEEGGALAKMIMPFRLGLGGPIGNGKQFLSWIHIEDMLKAIVFLMDNDKCLGPYNISSPNPNTNAFFSLKLAKRLDRPCMLRVPAFVIKVIMGEASDLVLYGQKVMPERLLASGFNFTYPTLVEALNGLDL